MLHYKHTCTDTHTCTSTAVSHILMTLLWPEHAWSGLGRGRDPGLTETHQSYRVREPKRLVCIKKKEEKTWRNSWGRLAAGSQVWRAREKVGIIPFLSFPPLPFKEKRLFFSLCRPPMSLKTPFPSTFSSPNLKPTLHLPPQHQHPSPPPSPTLN